MKNQIKLALIICTYRREEYIKKNIEKLSNTRFFDANYPEHYGRLEIFVVDNARELSVQDSELVHFFKNRNTGGSGGFQRGIEEVRRADTDRRFSHAIFMDDDVEFEEESFYILFDYLKNVDEKNADRPVAGRMLDKEHPNIQWTAAELWNRGDIRHVEFLRNTDEKPFIPGRVVYDVDADYGGFWFCCYPMSFVRRNDLSPFFLHCDDVEYGLRCGRPPVIIEGVHVWHETFEKRITPVIRYYDMRNSLLVNRIYGLLPKKQEVLSGWKEKITNFHVKEDWISEYMLIIAMWDFLRGMRWLRQIDGERYHKKLLRTRSNRWKNALAWRMTELRFLCTQRINEAKNIQFFG